MTAPLAPALTEISTRPGNPFLDWLGLMDSDGGQIAHYRLLLEPKYFDVLHRVFYAGGADLLYSLGYLLGSSYAAALMRLVLDPNQWLTPLTTFYTNITARVYAVVPPTAIMAATFAILIFSVFAVRSGAPAAPGPGGRMGAGPQASAGWIDQWIPSDSQIGKAQWQRLGSGLVMMGVVVVLATNPFRIIQEIVNAVLALAQTLSLTGDQGGTVHYVTSTTTDLMRSVTFLINYREFLTASCAKTWSMTINVGGANPNCLTPSQAAATDPDLWTVAIAAASVFIAWAFLSFALIVAIEFFKHLSLAVGYAISATWVAAATLSRRRPYDPLAEIAARAAAHFLLALGVLFVSATGPALFLQLVTSVLSFVPTLIQVLLAAAGYYLAGKVILRLMENQKSLLGLLRTKVKATSTWTGLYATTGPAAQPTVVGTATAGLLGDPAGYAKRRYEQLRTHTTASIRGLKDQAGQWATRTQGADNMITSESPELEAATKQVKLHPKPTGTVPITGGALLPAALTTAAITATRPVAAVLHDGKAITARDETTTPAPTASPETNALPPVWFRAGLPQFSPPPPQFSPPPSLIQSTPASTAAPSPAQLPPAHIPSDPFTAYREQRVAGLRAEAANLYPNLPQAPATAEEFLTRTTETYRGYQPDFNTPTNQSQHQALPDLRTILVGAQWIQHINHNKNLLAARGIEAIPVLLAGEESLERIVFATDSEGRNCVEAKNDRGFGDRI